MRLIRVFVDAALAPDARVTLGGTAAAHVRRVLRLEVGDELTLFNGDGSDYPATIAAFGRGTAEVAVNLRAAARPESPLAVTLMQGIARAERMDLVVQKATELGVAAIVPVAAARSVVKLDRATRERRLAHWRAIAVAACEQSGRARVPSIAGPLPLVEALAAVPAAGKRFVLAPDAPLPLSGAAQGTASVTILVGPEGGLEDEELRLAEAAAFQACGLGPRVLRSETAAIAAIVVLQAVGGDLRGDSPL